MIATQNQVDPSKTLAIRKSYTNKQRQIFATAVAKTDEVISTLPDNPTQNQIDSYLNALLALLMLNLTSGIATVPYVQAAYLRGVTNANLDLRAGGLTVDGAALAVLTQAVHRFSLQARQDQTQAQLRSIYMNTVTGIGQEMKTDGERPLIDRVKGRLKQGLNIATVVGGTALVGIVADAFLNRVSDFGIALVSAVAEAQFVTQGDDRVCFPKWTLVKTDVGDVPIQNLKPGMKVLTRKGYKPIKDAFKRSYSGDMVRVNTNIGHVYSTSDHPYWVDGKGWIDGCELASGYKLQSFRNKSVKVGSVVNFHLGNSNDKPPFLSQTLGFSGISSLVSMPVGSINFQGNPFVFQQEVNRVPFNLSFLNIFNPQSVKAFSNGFLNRSFSSELPVTRKGAKSFASNLCRFNPEIFPAIIASDKMGWPSTFLGTVVPPVSPFNVAPFFEEVFSTSYTPFIYPPLSICSTENRTVGVSVSNGTLGDCELLSATGANFDNGVFSELVSALHVTKLSVLSNLARKFFVFLATLGAGNKSRFVSKFRVSVATPGTKFSFPVTGRGRKIFSALLTSKVIRHGYNLLNKFHVFYHRLLQKSIDVYDIEVEDEHEFYANGLLVHNCQRCAFLETQDLGNGPGVYTIGQARGLIPVHFGCRCTFSAIVLGHNLPLLRFK